MYRVDFNRHNKLYATLDDLSVEQGGSWENAICAAFLQARPDAPDGPVHYYDMGTTDRKSPMLCFTFPSLYLAAKKIVETVETVVPEIKEEKVVVIRPTPNQFEALAMLKDGNIIAYNALHGKTKKVVMREGWVILDGVKPVLTDAGLGALASHN